MASRRYGQGIREKQTLSCLERVKALLYALPPLNTKEAMFNKKDSPDIERELASYRRQIDEIDDRIVKLLLDRTGIVERVGGMKRRAAPGKCPLRPGREAEMVRRIVKLFEGTSFNPIAAAGIWRLIIGMSTSAESPMSMSVYASEREHDLLWMAREYFGAAIPAVTHPHVKRVIGDLMDGKASVGIVPMLRGSDTSYWWTNLMGHHGDMPKIFARLPFVYDGQGRDVPSALAIGHITPEPSGDDCSVLVVEADHNVSQHRMQTAFAAAQLDVTWINIATLTTNTRHHLIEIRGFVTDEHPGIQSLRTAIGRAIFKISFLGAYAVPVAVGKETSVAKQPLHVEVTAT